MCLITLLTFSTATGNVVFAEEKNPADSVIKDEQGTKISGEQLMLPQMIVKKSYEYFDKTMNETKRSMEIPEETKVIPEEPLDRTVYPQIYPARFYLTDVNGKNYVSPVKMQNPWGTCWAFATIAAAETSIMYEKDIAVTKENHNPFDLSEKQVAWFSYVPLAADYENQQGGEGTYCIDENGNVTREPKEIYKQGGIAIQAEQLFTSAIGPIYEDVIPYRPAEANLNNYQEYAARSSADGKYYYWKGNGDWSVPDEMRQYYFFLLEETKMLPSSAGNNQEGVLAMKEELLSGRPIWIGYHADQYLPSDDMKTSEGRYIYVNEGGQCSQYTYDNAVPTHAVTIVGYNDEYSRYNFLEGHRPPGNGAWLVKNSWGTSEKYGTFPNIFPDGYGSDGSGYFWLSYYDKSITMEQTLNFDTSEEAVNEEGRFICEYDLLPSAETHGIPISAEVSYANVFRAEDKMKLREVGVRSQERDSRISVSVYRLNEDAKNPTDGVLLDTIQGSYAYLGFHKIALPQTHELKKDQKFSVVFTEEKDQVYYIPLRYTYNENATRMINANIGERALKNYNVGIVNHGESYQCINGLWEDYADTIAKGTELFQAETGIQGGVLAMDNFPIKAYGSK